MITGLLTNAFVALCFPKDISVDTDFESFQEADSPASADRKAFLGALASRHVGRRLEEDSWQDWTIRCFRLQLYYRARTPEGMLGRNELRFAQVLELQLRALPGWSALCAETLPLARFTCEPGYSVVNLVWPERGDTARSNLTGRGMEPVPLEAAMALIREKQMQQLLLPVNFDSSGALPLMRSQFEFFFPVSRRDDSPAVQAQATLAQEQRWQNFVWGELQTALLQIDHDQGAEVYWAEDFLNPKEFEQALQSDSSLAVYSGAFIVIYLTSHTRSLFISLGSLMLTFTAVPVALVLSSLVSGGTSVTAASFLSLFLIVGIGADTVLVFLAFWGLSRSSERSDSASRIRFLYKTAGVSCLATTLTTAASFFANIASVLRALREFGFFMGLCIVMSYCNLFFGLPAMFVTQEKVGRCCRSCFRCCNAPARLPRMRAKLTQELPWHVPSFEQCLSAYIERALVPHRRCCVAVFLLLLLTMAIWTASVARFDSSMPDMFPPGHNLRELPELLKFFEWIPYPSPLIDMTAEICSVGVERPALSCSLNWCSAAGDAPPLQLLGGAGNCTCEVVGTSCARVNGSRPELAQLQARIVGLAEVAPDFWEGEDWRNHVVEAVKQANDVGAEVGPAFPSGAQLEPSGKLVQEHWESGEVHVAPYAQAPLAHVRVENPWGKYCSVVELCYCGAPSCSMLDVPGTASDQEPLHLQVQGGRLPRRRLQQETAVVHLVWGVQVFRNSRLLGDNGKSWGFDGSFRPEVPSVQRQMIAACRGVDEEALLIGGRSCWVEDFRDWMAQRGEVFPARPLEFRELVALFAETASLSSGEPAKGQMWLDQDGSLQATFVEFYVYMSFMNTPTTALLEQKKRWDKYVSHMEFNPWHTSNLWIRGEAEGAIVGSTVSSIFMSVGFGFLGALTFTHGDAALAALVSASVPCVSICLCWFMSGAMGWAIGAMEILGLLVFGGYSLTFSLHVVHKYREHVLENDGPPPAARRQAAVVYALETMTAPTMGSAATTLGTTFFLFFCDIRAFVKLATVMFVVTVCALLFALVVLPSVLLCVGPLGGCTVGRSKGSPTGPAGCCPKPSPAVEE